MALFARCRSSSFRALTASPCLPTQNDRTPLSHAAQYGHAEVARALLAAGAHPAVRADSEKGGLAAIHYAAARGAVAVVRLLLQQPGANANARDEVRPSRACCAFARSGHENSRRLTRTRKTNVCRT